MRVAVACAVLAILACVHARSTVRQQSVSPQITSNGKDPVTQARVDAAFANVGRRAGVEVFRIQNFIPVPVATKDYGKFYDGDSYIVLKTVADKKNRLSWNIHYWIGSQSSQDEYGAAAALTVGLDDKFGGAAVQHRETSRSESALFKSYFSSPLQYLTGGHESGFNHVTTNAGAAKRLFQVKGKRNIRVRQVEPVVASMNKGDCFILDVDHDIYVYVGPRAKNVEKLKAISVANQVRDQDHRGRGRVDIIDTYSSDVDFQKFFTALGSGSKDSVPEESSGGDDQAFEKKEESTVTLTEISDTTGPAKALALTKPFRQNALKPQDVYILDTVSGSVFIWEGKQSTEKERNEANTKAQQLLSSRTHPSFAQVVKIRQGTETAIFKQYFATWQDVGMSHTRVI